ncbi:hypothetical protein CTT31_20705 [Pseudoalteromonas maricaloris]|uniref:hypothetical protein n=1 Tax=Pseudoalteromonas maricaloris TaxID=184924 RepID=UPI0021ADA66F|nr:hypothetical protein [Pseudoalteromonas flavipulchra]USE71509.1 hypothetical protein CTT31_20705 [Pseudoalteromonas flavipulchra]
MLDANIADTEIDKVIELLHEKFDVSSDRALSLKLGLSHSGIAMAKKKGTLPYAAIVNACIKNEISLDEVFGIAVNQLQNRSPKDKKDSSLPKNSVEDALVALALVEKITDDLLYSKNLDAERELLVRKKLQPMLIQKAYEHNFNEIMIRTIAEGALYMT